MSALKNIEYAVAFSSNRVDAGDINDPSSLSQVGTGGLAGTLISSTNFIDEVDGRSKVLAVDGTDSIIVDVTGNQIEQWADRVTTVGAGALPTGCALCTTYFGRVVLARQSANTQFFAATRINTMLDWDFGADPVVSGAVAGSDPTIGQPGDAIRALIAYRQDYLLFGCESSAYILVGDPSYDGQVVIKNRNIGVIGPNTFCFDEKGVL